MKTLSEQQVDFIRDRIRREGIETEDLENDVLDHLCCSVEYEMDRSKSFEEAFEKVFYEFVPAGGLQRLQLEIDMLNPKLIVMKKFVFVLASIAFISFFISILLHGIRLLNHYDWSFIEDLAFIHQYIICLFLLPLYWYNQYRHALKEQHDGLGTGFKSAMYTIGFLCSEAFVNTIFFKLMHLPGGDQLYVITAILGILYVPFYCLRKYKLTF
jgi:hypothetical protein